MGGLFHTVPCRAQCIHVIGSYQLPHTPFLSQMIFYREQRPTPSWHEVSAAFCVSVQCPVMIPFWSVFPINQYADNTKLFQDESDLNCTIPSFHNKRADPFALL